MTCPKCKAEQPDNAKFCSQCALLGPQTVKVRHAIFFARSVLSCGCGLFGLLLMCPSVLAQNLAQQKMCAEQARKFFTDPEFEHKDWTEYVSHYDPKAERCYILVRSDFHLSPTQWNVAFEIFDAFEGNLRAELHKDILGTHKEPYACSVKPRGQKKIFCKTDEEFDALIEKHFGMETP